MLLQIQQLSYEYTSQKQILQSIDLEIHHHHRVGLVGANGCGKSTLVQLLHGDLSPLSGSIHWKKGLRRGFLAQEVDLSFSGTLLQWMWSQFPRLQEIQRQLEELELAGEGGEIYLELLAEFEELGGYGREEKISQTLSRMGFAPADHEKPFSHLSSGQKKRAALCGIFVQEPDLLVMDEPTNHLDQEGIERLETYLQTSEFAFLLVTHDRRLLDRSVTSIAELEQGQLTMYSGNYTYYRKKKEEDYQLALHRYRHQQQQLTKLEKEFQQRAQWSKEREQDKFGQGPCDRGFIGHRAAKMMKRAKCAERRREQILERQSLEKPVKPNDLQGGFGAVPRLGNCVLELENLSHHFGEDKLFEKLFWRLGAGERLAVVGANGKGKTTLLRLILGELEPTGGEITLGQTVKVGYLSQNRNRFADHQTALEAVRLETRRSLEESRNTLASLEIYGPLVHTPLHQLSLGERTQVELASLFLEETNLLLLDEPTNHLDLRAREALEKSLLEFTGSMVFVSHDRYFCDKLATDWLEL